LQNPSHVYSTAGIYTATLTVTDSASNSAQASMNITVTDASSSSSSSSSSSGGSTGSSYGSSGGSGSGPYCQSALGIVISGGSPAPPGTPIGVQDSNFTAVNVGNSYVFDPTGSPWDYTGLAGLSGANSPWNSAENFGAIPGGGQTAMIGFNPASATGTISQSINLNAGTYLVKLASVPIVGAAGLSFGVYVDDTLVGTFTPYFNAPTSPGYVLFTSNPFTVTAGMHTLQFIAQPTGAQSQSGNYADLLTGVTIETAGVGAPNYYTAEGNVIPDFAENPTVVSTQSGNWSDPNTWSTGVVPGLSDIVSISPCTTVTYDTVGTVNTVAVQDDAALNFRTDISTELTLVNLIVAPGGTLQIGTQANPVAANVTAQVVFANQPLDTTADPGQWGHGLIGLGNVTMFGAPLNYTFVRLAADPLAGDTALTLTQPVTGWQVGDKVIVPDTRALDNTTVGASYVSEEEDLTIAGISGTTVTLSSPLLFNHIGAKDINGNPVVRNDGQTLRAHAADATRNVRIHSQSATGTRGYLLFTDYANVDIRYVQFTGLGRTTGFVENVETANDNTTYSDAFHTTVTHLGANQGEREPIIFLDLIGPATPQNNGFTLATGTGPQFTFVGNVVTCPLNPMPFRWGVTLSQSSYGYLTDNVVFNWEGAGIATEVGDESYNVLQHNFAFRTTGPGERGSQGLDGDAFWITSPVNDIANNVAAEINGANGVYSYGYELNYGEVGNQPAPYQGQNPLIPGQFTLVNMNATAIGSTPTSRFDNNEVYGASQGGMSYYWINSVNGSPQNAGMSTLNDFTAWHFYGFGIFGYQSYRLTLERYTAIGDQVVTNSGTVANQGFIESDYVAQDTLFDHANLQNLWVGIATPANMQNFASTPMPDATFTISNSTLNNIYDVGDGPSWAVLSSVDGFMPKEVIMNNVLFGTSLPGGQVVKLNMPSPTAGNPPGGNLGVADLAFDCNDPTAGGASYQVFYMIQAASYPVWQSILNYQWGEVAPGNPNDHSFIYTSAAAHSIAAPLNAPFGQAVSTTIPMTNQGLVSMYGPTAAPAGALPPAGVFDGTPLGILDLNNGTGALVFQLPPGTPPCN
jgi:hypothetical protein